MNRQNSFSLQKIPLRRNLARSNSQSDRLIFPREGDSNIFWGVGKKHYRDEDIPHKYEINLVNPQPSISKTKSVRNILSVADIEGASPSVAPQKVRNIKRGKEYLQKMSNGDSLGEYQKLFNLKQISLSNHSALLSNMSGSTLVNSSQLSTPSRRYNPTFVTSFAMQY